MQDVMGGSLARCSRFMSPAHNVALGAATWTRDDSAIQFDASTCTQTQKDPSCDWF